MQVVFGEDTNADLTADRYVALPDVTNINNVNECLEKASPWFSFYGAPSAEALG